ncbi:MAG: hypothetical protein Rhirs2KO_09670 [Rhizobiaceae bacterium]
MSEPLRPYGFLIDDQAVAALVLWGSGRFDTADIARLLAVREDAVCRTLHMAKDGARRDARCGA